MKGGMQLLFMGGGNLERMLSALFGVRSAVTAIFMMIGQTERSGTTAPTAVQRWMVMGMAENYKHLYEQTKKMLTMYQDELIPGFRKKIEELETASKWIPVTERLPDHGKIVLCRLTFNELRILQWDNVIKWWLGYGTGDDWRQKDVTHWMPLPEPPKEKDNER